MQINATRLTEEEKERRRSQRLCLYCGEAGHFRQNCPHRPINRDNAAVSLTLNCLNSKSSVTVPIEVFVNGKSFSTSALLDSGAAGNFMSLEFAELHKIPLIPCISPLSVEAVDGRPLGTGRVTHLSQELHMRTGLLHRELIQFYILQAPHTPVILGLPWLRKHDPLLQWTSGQIVSWGENCFSDCLSTVQPLTLRSIREHPDDAVLKCLPSMYHDLAEAFSRSKATKLPPHRSYDCAIDFLPNATPPKGRVFPLSQSETEAMQKYIEEELSKGFIRPSTSPASAGFFLSRKRMEDSVHVLTTERSTNVPSSFAIHYPWYQLLWNNSAKQDFTPSWICVVLTTWFVSARGMSGRRPFLRVLGTMNIWSCLLGFPSVLQCSNHS